MKSISEITLKPTDSLLLIGKAKDLKAVDPAHLNSVLKSLEIPETVRI